LTKKVEGVLEYGEHYVVQEYLTNPYLIDGLKFDMRIYVLLKSVWPLKIFIYKEGLGRFATQRYERPGKHNLGDMMMHLTNYAINKRSPNFVYNQKEGKDNVGHKRSLSSVLKVSEITGCKKI
jgi:tubulin polyglutamylase TTLL6/13